MSPLRDSFHISTSEEFFPIKNTVSKEESLLSTGIGNEEARKSVAFADSVQVLSFRSLSKREKRASFYSVEDLDIFYEEAEWAANKRNRKTCKRGLENLTKEGIVDSRNKVLTAVSSVLKAQRKNKDDDEIARVCASKTAQSTEEALERAKQDAHEVAQLRLATASTKQSGFPRVWRRRQQ
mmetsp:Transcript_32064/g.73702  ORF Transcript_32064/g.73702 Transcript_32064/m.73702 type:complete len:181 (-) Transcript_32064:213-755(-)